MSDMEPLIPKDAKSPERTTQVTRTLGAGMGGGYGVVKKDFSAVDAGFVRAACPTR